MAYFILKVGCAAQLFSDAAALLKSSHLPIMPFYCALSSHIIPLSVPTTSHFWRVENTHPHTEPGSRICSWFTQLFGDSDEQRLNHKHESMILHFNLWRGFFIFPQMSKIQIPWRSNATDGTGCVWEKSYLTGENLDFDFPQFLPSAWSDVTALECRCLCHTVRTRTTLLSAT